jgi:hypothetical protein
MRAGTWLLFILIPSFSFAQIKNIKLGDIGSTQPAIAINKKNPLNIVAATAPDNVFYTIDGGTTWQSLKVKSTVGLYGDPVLVSDDKGNIFSFHLSDPSGEGLKNEKTFDQILCHFSKDGGRTWEAGGPIGLNGPKDQVNASATVDSKGNVWVAWSQFDNYKSEEETCQSNVLLTYSSNGKKWSKPIHISQTPGNCRDDDHTVKGGMPAIGADGKAFVAWANQNKIFLDRSFSGGDLWLSNDITAVQQPGGWDIKVPGHDSSNGRPVLMIDQSKSMYQGCLYLMWADQRNGEADTDVWFARSTNFGDNWSTPLKVGEDTSKRHQYLPTMTVDQATGYIYAVFYDRRSYDDNQTDVFIACSTDGGVHFKSTRISENPFTPEEGPSFSDYVGISAHKGVITSIWTRIDDGKASVWAAVIKQGDLIQVPQASNKKKKK